MKIEHCRGCNAEIVWLKTVTGKSMPVDASSAKEGDALYAPKTKASPDGYHISHFGTCPQSAEFSRRNKQ